MSGVDARQPPRFVPTLTGVVPDAPTHAGLDAVQHGPANSTATMACPELARAEPELQPTEPATPWEMPARAQPISPAQQNCADVGQEAVLSAEELHAMRVEMMARLEDELQARLHVALSDSIQRHTQNFYQAVCADMDDLMRSTVQDVITHELAQHLDGVKR